MIVVAETMAHTFWTAFGASVLVAAVTFMGIFVIRRFERWSRENSVYFVCFAAGVLISVSFLHIIPKAFSMQPAAPFYLFAGYLGGCHHLDFKGINGRFRCLQKWL